MRVSLAALSSLGKIDSPLGGCSQGVMVNRDHCSLEIRFREYRNPDIDGFISSLDLAATINPSRSNARL